MPTRLTRRALLQGTGAATLLALLAACGGDDDKGATTTTGASTGGSGPKPAAEIDTLTVALAGSMTSLYPGKEAGILNFYVAVLTGEGLVSPDSSGKLVGALAETFEQTSPTTYVYNLRDNAKFSDGTAVTADDVVYSIGLAKDEEFSPNTAYYWANLAKAEKTGERQVTLSLNEPDVAFEWAPSASSALWVTSQKYVDEHGGELGTADSLLYGTGPYKVTKFTPDSEVVFERVDTWWGEAPAIKKVVVKFIPEESTRILAREQGDIDMAVSISLDQSSRWDKAKNTEVLYAPDRSLVCIDFNTAVAPFDDIHVRRAIAHACDREAFVKSLLNGHGAPATALTTPQQISGVMGEDGAVSALAAVLDLPYDMDKAKAELAQSKVPNGFTTKVGIAANAPQISSAFQALAAAVKPLGITIEIEEMPLEQWYGTIASPDWGLAYMWYFNTTGDPAELPVWFFGEGNPASYTNDSVHTLMNQAKAEGDPKKRAELLIEAQKTALADLPYMPLWWGEAATAISDKYTIQDYGSYSLLSPWTPRVTVKG